MTSSRASRAQRGVLVASFATFAALLSHVAAGGAMPGWLGIAAPWLLSVTVGVAFASRRLPVIGGVVTIAASQLLFHALFVLGAPSGSLASSHAGAHAHHGAAGADLAGLAPGATAGASPLNLLAADPAMWLGHAVAAVLTIAVFLRAEQAVRQLSTVATRLGEWTRRRVLGGLIAHEPLMRPASAPAVPAQSPLWERLAAPMLRHLRRRGPPLQLAF